MELVKGVPITEFCDKNHMPPEQRLKLFVDVCHAIQHAHHKGVIHRDVKPSNVMVTLHDGAPVVKVIDFGVAKATAQKLTERTLFTAYGQMVGTPAYMSPEQAEMSGLDIDTRSDVYSLGVLLYELLTGTTPLDVKQLREAGYAEMQRLIRDAEAPRPSTRLSSLGDSATILADNRGTDAKRLARLLAGDLDWIVMKALEKDRNRRYDTPGNFAEDIDRYLRGEAILARPPSTRYKLKKFAQRHRATVLTGAAIAVALLGGTVIATWQALRATDAEAAALDALNAKEKALAAEAKQRRLAEANEQKAIAAAEAENRAKRITEAKEAETRAVLDFVENKILAAARPRGRGGGLGHEVKLRQALESALPFVEQSFTQQPVVEARLRMTLGVSFSFLGEHKIAAEQFDVARAIYTKQLGLDHIDTLWSMNNLAATYSALGQHTDALKLHEETLGLKKAKLGPDHPATLSSMIALANTYDDLGRYEDSLKLHDETLTLRKARLGAEHPDTLRSMNNVAASYNALGRFDEAITLHEETVALMKSKLGFDHPDTLQGMTALANSYENVGRYSDALKLHEETLSLRKGKLGSDHPDTLQSMMGVANSYDRLGRHDAALALREQTLTLMKARLGPDHPDTLSSMNNLAATYNAVGRHADALKLHEETLALRKANLGPDHPDTLKSMSNLANSHYGLGQYSQAVKLSEEALTLAKAKLGADHPGTLSTTDSLAASYAALGRHADALKLREETLALRKASLGPDHPDILTSMGNVASSLVNLDRGAEALPIIDECVTRAANKIVDRHLIHRVMDLRLRHYEKAKDAHSCRGTAEMWEQLNQTDAFGLNTAARMRAVTAAVIRAADNRVPRRTLPPKPTGRWRG
jgi:tetratricopeptide (TPR) repeat protein